MYYLAEIGSNFRANLYIKMEPIIPYQQSISMNLLRLFETSAQQAGPSSIGKYAVGQSSSTQYEAGPSTYLTLEYSSFQQSFDIQRDDDGGGGEDNDDDVCGSDDDDGFNNSHDYISEKSTDTEVVPIDD
ncbi:hypothetical protein R6Q57_024749 [Mikania cordata]